MDSAGTVNTPRDTSPAGLAAAASALVAESFGDPWGLVSSSCYELAHIVRAWGRRPDRIPDRLGSWALDLLIRRQNPDGSWGSTVVPGAWRLLDVLAGVAALLAVRSGPNGHAIDARGEAALRCSLDWLLVDITRFRPASIPSEMAGWKYLLPALLEEIDAALADTAHSGRFAPALRMQADWLVGLADLRGAMQGGRGLPDHLDRLWELFDGLRPPRQIRGGVGCSLAVTAAAVASGAVPVVAETLDFLNLAVERDVPAVLPMENYERVWVLMTLLRTGAPFADISRERIIAAMSETITSDGVSMTAGWVPDADDTAATLFTLSRLGVQRAPSMLSAFEDQDAFTAFMSGVYAASRWSSVGARTMSVSVNAHVLEAIGSYLADRPEDLSRFDASARKAREFVLATQGRDGSWSREKWHCSPLYPTSCAVLALARFGGTACSTAVQHAVAWILATQREDGSWGRWCGTLEETAHALLALCLNASPDRADAQVTSAIGRGAGFLDEAWSAEPGDDVRTPLWIDKSLYQHRACRAYSIAARQAAHAIAKTGRSVNRG
jgi:squalene-hopene cyclase-like protein/prenyltransferase/squalene oxidase-like repeat protein